MSRFHALCDNLLVHPVRTTHSQVRPPDTLNSTSHTPLTCAVDKAFCIPQLSVAVVRTYLSSWAPVLGSS